MMKEAQGLISIDSPLCEIDGRDVIVPVANTTRVEYHPWS